MCWLKKQTEKQKVRHDNKHGNAKEYSEDDLVMTKNDAVNSTGTSCKLEPKYRGPYVADIPFAQRNQKPYSSVWSADRMKCWITFDEELNESVDEVREADSITKSSMTDVC